MATLSPIPIRTPMYTADGVLHPAWVKFFSQLYAASLSGTSVGLEDIDPLTHEDGASSDPAILAALVSQAQAAELAELAKALDGARQRALLLMGG